MLAVNDLTQKLVERARKGEGPFFIELKTYRYHGHHVGDINRDYYRAKDEEAEWKEERDPIVNFGKWLEGEGSPAPRNWTRSSDEVQADAEAAVAYALKAASTPTPSEVDMHVYADVEQPA